MSTIFAPATAPGPAGVAVVAMVLGPVAGSTTAMALLISASVVRLLKVMLMASLVLAPA